MAKLKKQYKQCTLQFIKNDSYTSIWVELKDAVKDKEINVVYPMFNLNGKAIVLKVYNGIIINEEGSLV